jgi:hypothetical protein
MASVGALLGKRGPLRGIQRRDRAGKMVDVGCIAKDAESQPDKESAERMSQGGRMLVITI